MISPRETGRRRRAPAREERLVDAERSKAALLDAALHEFADKGFAATRVRDIAEHAGVSKDLIAYHFGGKEGLYRAVQQAWLNRRDKISDADFSMAESLARQVHEALSDPRPMRLMAWRGLASTEQRPPDAGNGYLNADSLRQRQERGEIDSDIDPATLQLVLLGAVAAPLIFGDVARHLFGVDPSEPTFENRYCDGLQQILRCLRGTEEQENS